MLRSGQFGGTQCDYHIYDSKYNHAGHAGILPDYLVGCFISSQMVNIDPGKPFVYSQDNRKATRINDK
jgi:hypothetical protein